MFHVWCIYLVFLAYFHTYVRGGVAQWIGRRTSDQGAPGSIPRRCGLEQVTFTLCLVLVKPIWTDFDEAGDYVVPNVLSPRDLVSRSDIMDETVPHTLKKFIFLSNKKTQCFCNLNIQILQ